MISHSNYLINGNQSVQRYNPLIGAPTRRLPSFDDDLEQAMWSKRTISKSVGRNPTTTPPLKRIVQIPNQRKMHYIRRQSSSRRSRVMKSTPKESKRSVSARFRNPSPTPPIRFVGMTPKSGLFTPVRFNLNTSTRSERSLSRIGRYMTPEKENTAPRSILSSGRKTFGSTRKSVSFKSPQISQPQNTGSITKAILTKNTSVDTLNRWGELSADQAELIAWMRHLGLDLPEIYRGGLVLADPAKDLGFSNGIKLAELVGKVENTVIKGITKKPKKSAQVVNNINKSLEILRKRKHMRPTHLWSVKEIANGDYDVIWGLLYDIYQEYGKMFRKKYHKKKKLHLKEFDNMLMKSNITKSKKKNKVRTHEPSRKPSLVHQSVTSLELNGKEPLCTPNMKKEVKKWLHDINFDTWISSKETHTLRDVLRNGVFLCELVSCLEQKPVPGVVKHPLVLKQAFSNVEKALSVLRVKNSIPTVYLFSAKQVVQGNKDIFWGLLYHVMKIYPNAIQNKKTHYSKSRSLYDAENMRRLEMSVLYWLGSLGLFPQDTPKPKSIDAVLPIIQDGTLLCNLCAIIKGSKITGAFTNPKVKVTKISNISKALDFLRRQKSMATTFLFKENEIYCGDMNVILGLFEDIHRFYDNLPPKIIHSEKDSRGEPYLGVSEDLIGDYFDHNYAQNLLDQSRAGRENIFGQDQNVVEYMFGRNQPVPLRSSAIPIPATPPTEYRPNIPKPNPSEPVVDQRTFPEPFFPSSNLTNVLIPSPSKLNASVTALFQSSGQPIQHPESNDPTKPTQGFLLAKWLESIGIKIKSPYALDGPVLHIFCDGTLLCDIVGKLEHAPLKGITLNPGNKKASWLHNIKKALEVLKKRKTMPIDYLWHYQEILRGDGEVIRSILEQMRQSYNHRKSS